MNKLTKLLGVLLLTSCSKTALVQDVDSGTSSIISKTNYTDGKSGGIAIDFVSSENMVSFSQNLFDERDTLEVTYITRTQNFDSLVWVFQGAEPLLQTANATYTVSTTQYIDSNEQEQSVYGGIKSTVPYSMTIPYRTFGKFDVLHGASNSRFVDTRLLNDYVEVKYEDNRQDWEAWESSGVVGWVSTEEDTFSLCMESLVAFYTNQEIVRIKKPFTGFRDIRKNLIFDFKYAFQVFPNQDSGAPKLGLSLYPSESIPAGLSADDIPNLWENSNVERTEFRQVVIELPQVEEFSLIFTKYPGDLNENGEPLYPFTACIRNLRIVPSG